MSIWILLFLVWGNCFYYRCFKRGDAVFIDGIHEITQRGQSHLELFLIDQLLLKGFGQFVEVQNAYFTIGIYDDVCQQILNYKAVLLGTLLVIHYVAVPIHERGIGAVKLTDLVTAFQIIAGITMR